MIKNLLVVTLALGSFSATAAVHSVKRETRVTIEYSIPELFVASAEDLKIQNQKCKKAVNAEVSSLIREYLPEGVVTYHETPCTWSGGEFRGKMNTRLDGILVISKPE